MKTSIIAVLSLILLPVMALSQDFKAEFEQAFHSSDKAAQDNILKAWAKKNPNDADLFVSQFNFHINNGRSEVLALSKEQQNDDSLMLQDSTGTTAGFMGTVVSYDAAELKMAMDAINKGIALHPRRLDMRFGKIYLLNEDKQYSEFTAEVVRAINYGTTKHDWLWKDGKPLPDSQRFFLENIQGYVGMLYNTEQDALLPNMREISEAVLKYYPNQVESLSNIAITHLLLSEFDKALPYLLKAEISNPKDTVVLNNIAETYKRTGKNADAIKYYEKMILVGDQRDQEYAREQISKLN